MAQNITTYVIDAFTDQKFKGNPAGVCLLNNKIEDALMQNIAMELGYSETAFIIKEDDKYTIRFFSPISEIPLCGHATLASAKAMFDIDPDLASITFLNIQGIELNVSKNVEGLEMSFPLYDLETTVITPKLMEALGLYDASNVLYSKEINTIVIEINSSKLLRKLSPDYNALLKAHDSIMGVSVTALSEDPEYDFESRFFWPWAGTDEDPVTGAAHTYLAKYWGDKLDKTKMKALQCSSRTGYLNLEILEDNKLSIISDAQIVLKGILTV